MQKCRAQSHLDSKWMLYPHGRACCSHPCSQLAPVWDFANSTHFSGNLIPLQWVTGDKVKCAKSYLLSSGFQPLASGVTCLVLVTGRRS